MTMIAIFWLWGTVARADAPDVPVRLSVRGLGDSWDQVRARRQARRRGEATVGSEVGLVPVYEATVRIGDQTCKTDESGQCVLWVPPATIEIAVRAREYVGTEVHGIVVQGPMDVKLVMDRLDALWVEHRERAPRVGPTSVVVVEMTCNDPLDPLCPQKQESHLVHAKDERGD